MSPDFLRMPQEIKDYLSQASSDNIHQEEMSSLEQALVDTNALYMTHVQKELFNSLASYERVVHMYILTPRLMRKAR